MHRGIEVYALSEPENPRKYTRRASDSITNLSNHNATPESFYEQDPSNPNPNPNPRGPVNRRHGAKSKERMKRRYIQRREVNGTGRDKRNGEGVR
jgi:hypothetical protein